MALFEDISWMGLAVAVLLPWLAGVAVVRAVSGSQWNLYAGLGLGFFVGQIVVIVLLLAWDWLFSGLSFWPIAGALAGGSAVLLGATLLMGGSPRVSRMQALSWPVRLLMLALMGLVLWRFGTMVQELALRPLFAWDAWMNWAPKAVVWFYHGELTPFVLPPAWLVAGPEQEVYSLGNWRASGYPPGVPLVMLWAMLGADTADHTLVFLPWLFAPAAFALVLWGQLRSFGLGPALAMIVVYASLSLPFLNIHTMLPGYADLWLALYFALGAMLAERWQRLGQPGDVVLALAMAAGCSLMKTPGIVFGGLIVLALILGRSGIPPRWLGRSVMVVAAGVIVMLLGGLTATHVSMGGAPWALPLPGFLPELRIQPEPLLPILFSSLFVASNWHLLGPVFLLTAAVALRVRGTVILESVGVLSLVVAAALLVFVFGYTQYFEEARNLVTLNRTLVYLVPLSVYVMGVWLAACQYAGQTGDA